MDLADRARRAYEWGRLRSALRVALFAPAITVLSVFTCGSSKASIACGALLTPVAIFFAWRGEGLGRGVLPGVLGGLAPFSLALCLGLSGHACATTGFCELFLGACLVGGGVAGVFVASAARGNRTQLLASAVLAGLIGSLGCVIAGGMGLLGLGAGILLGAAPVLVLRPRAQ